MSNKVFAFVLVWVMAGFAQQSRESSSPSGTEEARTGAARPKQKSKEPVIVLARSELFAKLEDAGNLAVDNYIARQDSFNRAEDSIAAVRKKVQADLRAKAREDSLEKAKDNAVQAAEKAKDSAVNAAIRDMRLEIDMLKTSQEPKPISKLRSSIYLYAGYSSVATQEEQDSLKVMVWANEFAQIPTYVGGTVTDRKGSLGFQGEAFLNFPFEKQSLNPKPYVTPRDILLWYLLPVGRINATFYLGQKDYVGPLGYRRSGTPTDLRTVLDPGVRSPGVIGELAFGRPLKLSAGVHQSHHAVTLEAKLGHFKASSALTYVDEPGKNDFRRVKAAIGFQDLDAEFNLVAEREFNTFGKKDVTAFAGQLIWQANWTEVILSGGARVQEWHDSWPSFFGGELNLIHEDLGSLFIYGVYNSVLKAFTVRDHENGWVAGVGAKLKLSFGEQ